MYTGLIIAMVSLLLVVIIRRMVNHFSNAAPVKAGVVTGKPSPANNTPTDQASNGIESLSNQGEALTANDVWWNQLPATAQLQLALLLTQKALPLWEKYSGEHELSYRDSPALPPVKIDRRMLPTALDEIDIFLRLTVSGSSNENIVPHYFHFVGPVIAMQDGTWVPPYPIKKIFLSVYYMLKSIIEQSEGNVSAGLPGLAITQALDCLDVSKLYTKDAIELLLKDFRPR